MPFVEDPVHLSKTRLKSDLIAHNVELPPAASKKEVYVELHLKHIDQKNAADFSSDDEDPVENNGNEAEDAKVPDPCSLTGDDLKAALLNHGVKAGPIVASTRALYEKKLWKLLHRDGNDGLNGAEKAVLYSDSEEEEEEGEGNAEEEEKEAGLEQEQQDTAEEPEQIQSSELPPEPVKEILKDLVPDTITTPTGIYATSRRPIKGAAQRPIQYAYPDTPVSPMTLERREVERHLVPIQIQILVFFTVAFILYFIYVNVEDSSSVLALLNSFNQWSDSKEGVLPQSETQDTRVVSGQD